MTANTEQPVVQREVALQGIAHRLEGEFGEMFTRDTLDHYVHDSYDRMAATWRIATHIPAFVERFARQRLRALAKNRGMVEGHRPEVLFVCARNDAASQMAASLFTLHVQGRAAAHSAGTTPAAELRAEALHVIHEVGADLSAEFTRPITPEIEAAADVVVTLDAHDDVPIVDGKHYVAWHMPAVDGTLESYRRLRDALDERVQNLAAEIAPPSRTPRKAYDAELAAAAGRVLDMGRSARRMLDDANRAVASMDDGLAATIVAADDDVDAAYLDIERTIIEIVARQQPVASDLRQLVALLQTALHLERIADAAVDIARAVGRAHPADDRPVPDIPVQLASMGSKVADMVDLALRALDERDRSSCLDVVAAGTALGDAREDLFDRLVTADGLDDHRAWVLWMDRIARIMERAGDHAVDIAEAAWFEITGELREFDHDGPVPVPAPDSPAAGAAARLPATGGAT